MQNYSGQNGRTNLYNRGTIRDRFSIRFKKPKTKGHKNINQTSKTSIPITVTAKFIGQQSQAFIFLSIIIGVFVFNKQRATIPKLRFTSFMTPRIIGIGFSLRRKQWHKIPARRTRCRPGQPTPTRTLCAVKNTRTRCTIQTWHRSSWPLSTGASAWTQRHVQGLRPVPVIVFLAPRLLVVLLVIGCRTFLLWKLLNFI